MKDQFSEVIATVAATNNTVKQLKLMFSAFIGTVKGSGDGDALLQNTRTEKVVVLAIVEVQAHGLILNRLQFHLNHKDTSIVQASPCR